MLFKKAVIALLFLLVPMLNVHSQNMKVIKLKDLQESMTEKTKTVYVVNFWATWCAPCVKEIPDFEKLKAYYMGKEVKVILVSLDFKKDEEKVRSFIKKNSLKNDVVLLDETKYHEWIDKIEPTWGGAIPATLILKKSLGFKKFIGNSVSFEELKTIIDPLL